MADTNIDFQALAQAIDTTFGRSSTPQTSSFSLKALVLDAGRMRIDFHTYINFANDKDMVTQKQSAEHEAKSRTKDFLANIKKEYKKLSESKTLKAKETSSGGNFELVGFGAIGRIAKRTAHYKFTTIFEIG